ncbi:SBBP repeat-containing protein [Hymenobacter sp. BT175]|uniref:SBBP repeat-containing protein n=1 Tax=Hymenobacter translucens TaxID=2886507 RepID=UPI001D0DC252|nr:SBBP repeat-containing protein [Hymenobacter translucens]MCC2548454.1 SBBP repeat-containing protein [Hymenobacter translucens]
MTKQLVLFGLFCFLLINNLAWAQVPDFQWTRTVVAPGDMFSKDVAVDKAGNVFVTGSYFKSLTLGSIQLIGKTTSNIFLAKYNAAGTLIWARSASSSDIQSFSLAVDAQGNAFVAGWFRTSADFGTSTLAGHGDEHLDAFLAKYDGAGQLQWVQSPDRKEGESRAHAVAVDAAGNAYLTGLAEVVSGFGTARFPAAKTGFFLAKYSPAGQLAWAQVMEDLYTGSDITVDNSGGIYVTVNEASNALTFGATKLGKGRDSDQLLAKFSSSGTPEWARRISSADGIGGIATDAKGRVLLTGTLVADTLRMDGGAPVLKPKERGVVAFLACYGANGTWQWGTTVAGKGDFISGALAVDGTGNSYVAGHLLEEPNDPAAYHTLAVAKNSPDGKLVWTRKVAGKGHGEEVHAVAADQAGSTVVIGKYFGTPTFGATTLPKYTLPSGFQEGCMFVTKLAAASAGKKK